MSNYKPKPPARPLPKRKAYFKSATAAHPAPHPAPRSDSNPPAQHSPTRPPTRSPHSPTRSPHHAGEPRALSEKREVKVYGLHACQALFKKRPQDIIRLYCLETMIPRLSALVKHCVEHKKAYHVISAEELARVTDSIHHEGVCILTKERTPLSFDAFLAELKKCTRPLALIYLEGVENPHNIGSIMRICAHFGVQYLLTDRAELAAIPSATYRVAKGGVEEVAFVPLKEPLKMLQHLKDQGFALFASSSHAKKSLYQTKLPEKALFVFGSETHGIAEAFIKRCAEILAVPGSGKVESLNVSMTSGLFLGEFWRQHGSVK